MLQQRMALWLSLVLVGLSSCTTNVAMFDSTFGFEEARRGRSARVLVQRAEIHGGRAPSSQDVSVRVPGASRSSRTDGTAYHELVLRMVLRNEGKRTWRFRPQNLRFRFVDSESDRITRCAATFGKPLKTLRSGATEEVNVPVTIALPKNVTMRDAERYWLEMRVYAEPGGDVLAHRRLVLGAYNQGWQVLRFGGLLTALLVLAAV